MHKIEPPLAIFACRMNAWLKTPKPCTIPCEKEKSLML